MILYLRVRGKMDDKFWAYVMENAEELTAKNKKKKKRKGSGDGPGGERGKSNPNSNKPRNRG